MLAVNGSKDALALRYLEPPYRRSGLEWLERQLLVARDDHGTRDGRQVPSLATLLVVLHEFVDLSPDDLALVCLLARPYAPLQQVPVHFGRDLLLAAPNRRLTGLPVVQHLEAHELVDVFRSQRCLIELHPKLLHPDGRDVYHVGPLRNPLIRGTEEANCSDLRP